MGAGKTTVGRMVARNLHLAYVDTDEAIEARAGRAISSIFAELGEVAFRQLEREVLADVVAGADQVISTGGGLVCQLGNLELLQESALVICLWASPETIWERVKHQNHRPLLQVEDPRAAIERMLEAREPFYRRADVLVNSGLRSLREVAAQVTHHFLEARRRPLI